MEDKNNLDEKLEEIVEDATEDVAVEKQESYTCEVPTNHYFAMNMQRLGEITGNMATVAASLIPLCALGMVMWPFAMVLNCFLAIVAVVCTVGVLLLSVNFSDMILIGPNSVDMVIELMGSVINILSIVTLVLSIISIVALSMNKRNKSTGRIVGNICMIIFVCLCFAMKMTY
ncbi:MAG: hypothetical protein J6V40_01015 [Clostridia bacterium]|nr:hypothetical protein [Clostridia bacterium]